jgi:hypothetical protein
MKKALLLFAFLGLLFTTAKAGEGWKVSDLKAAMQFETRGNLGIADSVWLNCINRAMEDLATTVDCTMDTHVVICSTTTAIYELPTDCLKLRGVRELSSGKAIDIIELNQELKAGTGAEVEEFKISWTTKGIKMMIFTPTPIREDTVIIFYLKDPITVDADSDTVPIAPPYHPALVSACLKVLYRRLERWDASNNYAVDMINKINNTEIWMKQPGPDVIIGKRVIGRTE